MRTVAVLRRPRLHGIAVVLALAAGTTGCARAALQYGRDGLAPVDRVVREHLMAGKYGSAYEASFDRDAAARDRLLRALSAGTLGFYASRTDSSVWALDRAWSLMEDRYSKQVTRLAGSLLVNDYVLPYMPGRTERLFIPFYGALSWLARGDRDDAAVEARRLAQVLGEGATDSASRYTADGELRGVMHYVAGAVFEAAGERADADVAYRNAARLVQVPVTRDTTAPDSLMGDVVVVLEQGFVGHPVPREDAVWLSHDEVLLLRRDGGQDAFRVAERIRGREGMRGAEGPMVGAIGMFDGGLPGSGWYGHRGYSRARMPYRLSLAWSEFVDGRGGAPQVTLVSAGLSVPIDGDGNVSRAVRADFERTQPARFARALMRAAARATLMKAGADQLDQVTDDSRREPPHQHARPPQGTAEAGRPDRRAAERDRRDRNDRDDRVETFVKVLGAVGLMAAAAAADVNDVPDVRSWNLLPHGLRVVRLRLPAGEQEVRATVGAQEVSLGRVTVPRGGVVVLAQRFFRAPAGALASTK